MSAHLTGMVGGQRGSDTCTTTAQGVALARRGSFRTHLAAAENP